MDIVLSDFSSCMPSDNWRPPSIASQLMDPSFSDSYQSSCNDLDLGTLQILRTSSSGAPTQRHAAYIDVNRLTVPHEYMQRSSSVVNDLLSPLLQSVGILDHRDAVGQYLRLTPDLWNALFRPNQPSPAQQLLSRHLSEIYGILPAGLWDHLVRLRTAPRFEPFQNDFVKVLACVPNARGHSQSSAGVHKHEEPSSRKTLHPPRVNSPGDSVQIPCSVADPTMASMKIATRGRTHVRGPSQRAKGSMSGRAPWGYRYFCPADHCAHQPFRNAGNYLIHMARFHAEYPKHDPAASLRADPSPVDDGEEGISSPTTNTDDSPGYMRTWSAEDFKAVQDTTLHAEDTVYRPSSAYRDHGHCQGGFEHAGTHTASASSSIGAGADSAMEEAGSSSGVPFGLAVVEPVSGPEHSPISDDWLSFGMFQAELQHPACVLPLCRSGGVYEAEAGSQAAGCVVGRHG